MLIPLFSGFVRMSSLGMTEGGAAKSRKGSIYSLSFELKRGRHGVFRVTLLGSKVVRTVSVKPDKEGGRVMDARPAWAI